MISKLKAILAKHNADGNVWQHISGLSINFQFLVDVKAKASLEKEIEAILQGYELAAYKSNLNCKGSLVSMRYNLVGE